MKPKFSDLFDFDIDLSMIVVYLFGLGSLALTVYFIIEFFRLDDWSWSNISSLALFYGLSFIAIIIVTFCLLLLIEFIKIAHNLFDKLFDKIFKF